MAQNFIPLYCGVLFVLCQIVITNALTYCGKFTPAVKLCTSSSGTSFIVYVDTVSVKANENRTCWCTLDGGSGIQDDDVKVRRIRVSSSGVEIVVRDQKLNFSSGDIQSFDFTPNMPIKFEMGGLRETQHCYGFEFVKTNAAKPRITVACVPAGFTVVPENIPTTLKTIASTDVSQNSTVNTRYTGTIGTSTSIDNSGTQRAEQPREKHQDTTETSSLGATETGASSNTREAGSNKAKLNIGVIAGAAGGGLAVVVAVVIITVVVCKRRVAADKGKNQDASDIHNEEPPEYSLTTNAGYVSADDCHREVGNATGHDPRGYTLVNKPRPKQHHTQQTAVDEDNYNHLNDVLHTHNPANVYNTRAEAPAESDIDDYNRLNEFRKPNETDNVYNVASSSTSPSNEYDRTNVPTRNGPADYEYSTTNKVYKP